jgi:glycosyltransferase involved in cell wall biosynthesis
MKTVLTSARTNVNKGESGDKTQIKKTLSNIHDDQLEAIWIESPQRKDLEDADALHIFNLPFVFRAEELVRLAKETGTRCVVSPIFWDFSHSNVVSALHYYLNATPNAFVETIVPWVAELIYLKHRMQERPDCLSLDSRAFARVLEAADLVLPNSSSELTKLAEFAGLELEYLRSKSHVVYNAVEVSDFAPRRGAKDRIRDAYGVTDYVLQVGRLSPNKNQQQVIEAVQGLDASLLLIGRDTGRYSEEVREAAASTPNVHVLGEVPHSEIADFFAAASVHVLPSFRESPGLVSLEAAVSGCEIVVSDERFCPVEEYFGRYVHVCNPYSVRSIRRSIKQALRKGKNSVQWREKIQEDLSWEKVGSETVRAYKQHLVTQ